MGPESGGLSSLIVTRDVSGWRLFAFLVRTSFRPDFLWSGFFGTLNFYQISEFIFSLVILELLLRELLSNKFLHDHCLRLGCQDISVHFW
jgi:hypothetical protein